MGHERVIVHLDMDAFFAAIEQRDNPDYRGLPVVVGADPKGGKGRGVVSTCSYEARRYGIHSAQPISQAYRLCPHAVFVRGRGGRYEEVSSEIRRILSEFTPVIEPVSIDEAFLDVTGTVHLFGGKHALAQKLQARIEAETGLTASLGVAPNKMVAKIASDMNKPRGLVIVEPDRLQAFLRPLPVGKLWGVGEKTERALKALGIRTIGDLADADREELARRFGKYGGELWELAHGRDERPVETAEEVKSVGNEHTFERDTDKQDEIASTMMQLCEKVAQRLREGGWRGRTVTTKVRLADFTTLTRARTLDRYMDSTPEIFEAACANLERAGVRGRKVRLVGVTVSGLQASAPRQTQLFDRARDGGDLAEKWRRLGPAIDRIKERYGDDALRHATSLRRREGEPGRDRQGKRQRGRR